MDALLLALQDVCRQLLPIIGAVVLIFLCILLKKVWKLIDSLTDTVRKLDPTLRLVDKSIEKVQAPLDTVVRYSKSMDNMHGKTSEALGKAAEFASENVDQIKSFVQDKIAGKSEEVKEEEE